MRTNRFTQQVVDMKRDKINYNRFTTHAINIPLVVPQKSEGRKINTWEDVFVERYYTQNKSLVKR
jgi:hypothetical protein